MRKKKIIQWMSIILLLIYAVIFVIMLVNLGMMQQAAEDMSSGVLATTRAAVYYALIHGGCNLCFNAMALLSLKYRKLTIPTIFVGLLISVVMCFVSNYLLGTYWNSSLAFVLRMVMIVVLSLLYRDPIQDRY